MLYRSSNFREAIEKNKNTDLSAKTDNSKDYL